MPFGKDTCVVLSNIVLKRGPGFSTGREYLRDRNPQSKFALKNSQNITESGIITIDSLYVLSNTLSNDTIAKPIGLLAELLVIIANY